jgi:Ca2+-binding EF-hand superfamily protein
MMRPKPLNRFYHFAPMILPTLAVLLALSGEAAVCQETKAPTAATTAAALKAPPMGATVEGDALDLVFLGVSRPVFLRLHVQVEGVGHQKIWQRFVAKYFDYVDRDGDGVLSTAEADAGISSLGLAGGAAVMDTDPRDGRVTREEWAAWLRSRGEPRVTSTVTSLIPARFLSGPGGRMMRGDTAGNELWKYLDADGDRVLTLDEVTGALTALRKLDLDDDEMIAGEELRPYEYGAEFYGAPNGSESGPPDSLSLMAVLPTASSTRSLASALIARYDGRGKFAKDRKLSAEELGLDSKLVNDADADGDGLLDFEELGHMLRRVKPQLALVVRFGGEKDQQTPIALAQVDGRPAALASAARVDERAHASVELTGFHLRVSAARESGKTAYESQYKRIFEQADRDNNKYLDENEFRNNFANQFALVDRDKNGMVYLEELVAYYAKQTEIRTSRIAVQGTDHGKMIFDALDVDGDGQLSQRELAGTWKQVSSWDRDGDNRVAVEEIPHQFSIIVGRGSTPDPARLVAERTAAGSKRASAPAWFTKMDRNGDGDISPREFLGTREVFDRLDANRDGLIDAREAAGVKQDSRR